jgi:hypothetical protein
MVGPALAQGATGARPNIVFVLADNVGWGDFSSFRLADHQLARAIAAGSVGGSNNAARDWGLKSVLKRRLDRLDIKGAGGAQLVRAADARAAIIAGDASPFGSWRAA